MLTDQVKLIPGQISDATNIRSKIKVKGCV
jgi:hypothetical protein